MEHTELEAFRKQMENEEKSPNTVIKYLHDVADFLRFQEEQQGRSALDAADWTREDVICYKKDLQSRYQVSSVNSMLNAVNAYLHFIGRPELCVKMLKQQRRLFCDDQKLLRRRDYRLLVEEAEREGKTRLSCILQTLAMTGIRIGELHEVTCEALEDSVIHIDHKGKIREIVLPKELVRLLKGYCKEMGITSGPVFVTRTGRPVDRKNVWREMKTLCSNAGVNAKKVFPHNFRHFFASSFYGRTKDIVRLADYLGHSSLDTTRRYTMTSTIEACQKELDLGLLITKLYGKIRKHAPASGNLRRNSGRKKKRYGKRKICRS